MAREWLRQLALYDYQPLLKFVNEPLTPKDWMARVRELEDWQLEWELGLDSCGSPSSTPSINGFRATMKRAQQLQTWLRKQLTGLARLCRDRQRLLRESEPPVRGGDRAWTWRRALVLPTMQMFFKDAGEGLKFFVEKLEFEIKQRAGAARTKNKYRRRSLNTQLHLSLCGCGCGQFFLWEGNWYQKKRKFLNDKHRMDFHNRRNVERKKKLARRRRKEGHQGYF